MNHYLTPCSNLLLYTSLRDPLPSVFIVILLPSAAIIMLAALQTTYLGPLGRNSCFFKYFLRIFRAVIIMVGIYYGRIIISIVIQLIIIAIMIKIAINNNYPS